MPTVEEVRQALADLSCDTRGCKRVLKKRLRDAKKKQIAQNDEGTQVEQESAEQKSVEQTADEQPMDKQTLIAQEPSKDVHFNTKTQPFDYYLFFDVEATCEENGGFDFPNEIIEFPVVLVSGETFEIVRLLPFL
ncbi:3'-5' exoribonuclease 1 [Apophysomyces sp. BC1034]|nr:3'-5' exoribonuclease 1 [Apophysomyces sp. BC1015]KAG0193777.1 3'-5' exoribonuclease 1 [Apophysomyces sp. BC1034]